MNGKRNAMACIVVIWIFFIQDARAVAADTVACITDRESYRQGENVIVTITNQGSDEIAIIDRNQVDGGFASIEIMQRDGTWRAIELYAAANITRFKTLKKGASHGYLWKTVGYNRSDTVAAPGEYRITLGNGIISNRFFVTHKIRSR